MLNKDMKYNIELDSIKTEVCEKKSADFTAAQSQMRQRTHRYRLYGLLAKNKSIHDYNERVGIGGKQFSEGSTQYIMRKVLADTIQRMPDGELVTQYDKNSWQSNILNYIFENKIMWSEFEGIDMLSNLTNTFKMSFIYAFAPVRMSFEKDYDNDIRVSYNLEHWADVFINPDCDDIRRPEVIYHRQYMSKAEVENLLDEDGNVFDSTYNEDAIKYVLDHEEFSARLWESEKMADQLKGSTSIASLELVTEYRRGADEFVTFIPKINAEFRRVPNYDPRLGIPWQIFVLEPDPDFPLGVSQVEFLLADQQFNDLFQTSAYKNLLLAMEPPIMVSGWETNPSSYVFEPRKIWNLGNNPNQVNVEPVRIDNTILTNWAKTRESVASSMLRNLNVADGTVASDAGTTYSKTAPGVEAQQNAKTITVNQYQKRIEAFISDWANMALRCYLSAMKGKQYITVDEETRRKIWDCGHEDLVEGNKVLVDFSELSSDELEFRVRAGSLVQRKEDQERQALLDLSLPFVQNLNGWSDENRQVVENEVLLPIAKRMLELSDTDIGQSMANDLGEHMAFMIQQLKDQLEQQQAQVDEQQTQIDEQQQMMNAITNAMQPDQQQQIEQQMLQQQQEQPVQPMPQEAMPVPMQTGEAAPVPAEMQGGAALPSSAPLQAEQVEQQAGQQIISPADLLNL